MRLLQGIKTEFGPHARWLEMSKTYTVPENDRGTIWSEFRDQGVTAAELGDLQEMSREADQLLFQSIG